jgi:integrase
VKGSTFKRCACRDETGRQLGATCPRLKSPRHGSWYLLAELPPGANGRRRQHRRGGFTTQRDAQAALDALRTRLGLGQEVDDRQTTGDYLEQWLIGKRRLRPTTARSYEMHLRLYLVPHLGHIPLERLRPAHISAMFDAILTGNEDRQRAVGAASLRRIHATLRSALNAAVKCQRLPVNPAVHVELPDASRPKVKPWSAAELGVFLDAAAGDRLSALYEVMAMTGLRRGEAVGLRWCDVDLELQVLTVIQQIMQLGYQTAVGAPKTSSGEYRRVDLDAGTVAALLAHQLRQEMERGEWGDAWADWQEPFRTNPKRVAFATGRLLPSCGRNDCSHGLVFTREDGSHLHPEYVTRHMQRLAKKAGLPAVRLHDLRHGSASLQLAAGVPIAIVSKRLGHSSIAITSDTYSHLLEGVGRAAAEQAAALVPRSSRSTVPTSSPQKPENEAAPSLDDTKALVERGGPPGDRTQNPRIKSPLLCQLS